jgi:Ca2+-dependent lipid-binding protein
LFFITPHLFTPPKPGHPLKSTNVTADVVEHSNQPGGEIAVSMVWYGVVWYLFMSREVNVYIGIVQMLCVKVAVMTRRENGDKADGHARQEINV